MFFICVLSSLFANEIRYIVTNDIKARSCEDSNDNKQFVKDEELIFTYESLLDYYNSEISLKNPQDDNWYVFPIDFVQPYDNKYKITTSISKNPWIPFYYYDLLKSKNKIAELLKFEPFWNEWENYTDDEGLTWEKDFAIQRYYFDDYSFSIKTNVTRWLGLDSITLIKEISSNKIEYEVQAVFTGIYREDTDNLYNHPWFEKLLNKKTPFLLILTIDGDYMKIYIDEISENSLFQTLVRTTQEECDQIENWIKGISNDLSSVAWPRHADGSCDYDDEIKPPVVQLSDDSSFVADEEEKTSAPTDLLPETDALEATDDVILTTGGETSAKHEALDLSFLIPIAAWVCILVVLIVIVVVIWKKRRK